VWAGVIVGVEEWKRVGRERALGFMSMMSDYPTNAGKFAQEEFLTLGNEMKWRNSRVD
jgi:hypothetical protein